ncbi:hypothetical protein L2E82_12221 [Cichorium intybus]|uniref:Uncharacterized protein n=1 Tax=Cichorium intybus TaxID=13427 RepID=A0ACB9GGQ6_CICIN|nr:hypothetical protein L2E82_12221 [Cichorium intybus]
MLSWLNRWLVTVEVDCRGKILKICWFCSSPILDGLRVLFVVAAFLPNPSIAIFCRFLSLPLVVSLFAAAPVLRHPLLLRSSLSRIVFRVLGLISVNCSPFVAFIPLHACNIRLVWINLAIFIVLSFTNEDPLIGISYLQLQRTSAPSTPLRAHCHGSHLHEPNPLNFILMGTGMNKRLIPDLKTAKDNFEMALEVDNSNTHARYWLSRLDLRYHVPGQCKAIEAALLVEVANMGDAAAQYELGRNLRIEILGFFFWQKTMSPVYVGNLDPRVSERELQDEFRVYGVLRNVWVARRPPGYAFVEFDDRRDADAIRALDECKGIEVATRKRSRNLEKSYVAAEAVKTSICITTLKFERPSFCVFPVFLFH